MQYHHSAGACIRQPRHQPSPAPMAQHASACTQEQQATSSASARCPPPAPDNSGKGVCVLPQLATTPRTTPSQDSDKESRSTAQHQQAHTELRLHHHHHQQRSTPQTTAPLPSPACLSTHPAPISSALHAAANAKQQACASTAAGRTCKAQPLSVAGWHWLLAQAATTTPAQCVWMHDRETPISRASQCMVVKTESQQQQVACCPAGAAPTESAHHGQEALDNGLSCATATNKRQGSPELPPPCTSQPVKTWLLTWPWTPG